MAATCPYCRTEIIAGDGSAMECTDCSTPHHIECYEENGGCTLFGCKSAPPDEPKVQVTNTDVNVAVAHGAGVGVRAVSNAFGDAQGNTLVSDAPRPAPPPPPPSPQSPGAVALGDGLQMNVGPVLEVDRKGYFVPGGIFSAPDVHDHKSRITFVMLGIFLGYFGAHNFYLGHKKRGAIQLAITVLTLGYGSAVTWIWAIVEVCTMDRDANNITLA
jgi:TM2 domain-containing membrane protein YozV